MSIADQVQAVKFDDVREVLSLTPEEEKEVKERFEKIKDLIAYKQEKRGQFKIEIMFEFNRSARRPIAGVLTFWNSGSKLHGGGDSKLYFCPGKHLNVNECKSHIASATSSFNKVICQSCGTLWERDQIIGEVFGRHSMRDWACLVYDYYRRLDFSCDLVLKHSTQNFTKLTAIEQEKQKGGELLNKGRDSRQRVVYTLESIIKDTSNGADMLERFHSFLRA